MIRVVAAQAVIMAVITYYWINHFLTQYAWLWKNRQAGAEGQKQT